MTAAPMPTRRGSLLRAEALRIRSRRMVRLLLVLGALGLPTWVMVAHPAEWRWGRDRTACLFYPHTTVLRQHAGGDWSAVVLAVRAMIEAWRNAHR